MKIRKERRMAGRKLMALFLGLMLLLLPFAFSFPTQAEDNQPAGTVNPNAGQSPATAGSDHEQPQTPDTNSNSNNGNSETPAANSDQPGTPDMPVTPGTPGSLKEDMEPGTDSEVPGIPVIPVPARDFSNTFKKAPIQKAPPEGIKIDNTNFPDEIFREQIVRLYDLKENGGDGNGFLNEDELSKMAFLFLYESDFPTIADLHGLNYFTSLDLLTIGDKPLLTKLDVSGLSYLSMLTVCKTAVNEITFEANSSLSSLICSINKLTSLDVQTLTNLYNLSCDYNQLTNLTLGRHPHLQSLYCNNNSLSTLSLNQCENLETLICNDNRLTTLDLSNNPKLSYLEISNNHLTSLDVSNNRQLSAENFKGKHQTYSIEVDRDTLEFDLSSLPGNFIPARASEWKGASVSGMTLNLDPSMPATVTYNYDADQKRDGFIMDVTLFVTYVSRDILIPCPYGAVICPTQPAYQTIPLTPVPVQQKQVDDIQGQVAQLPKTGEQEPKAVAISSLLLLSLGAFLIISRRK